MQFLYRSAVGPECAHSGLYHLRSPNRLERHVPGMNGHTVATGGFLTETKPRHSGSKGATLIPLDGKNPEN